MSKLDSCKSLYHRSPKCELMPLQILPNEPAGVLVGIFHISRKKYIDLNRDNAPSHQSRNHVQVVCSSLNVITTSDPEY